MRLELLHGFGLGLDENEIDSRADFVALGIRHVAIDVAAYVCNKVVCQGYSLQ